MSDSLWPHGLQHARLPCPSLTPRVCSNSCPFSQWCHPTISSSVAPFSFCPQSFPASGSLPVSQLLHLVAKGLELQLQHQPFQWIFRVDFLYDGLVWFPCCPRDSQESSLAPQFETSNLAKRQPKDEPLPISTKHFSKVLKIPTLSLQWPMVPLLPV